MLTLSGTSTYSGTTTVNYGTLTATASAVLGHLRCAHQRYHRDPGYCNSGILRLNALTNLASGQKAKANLGGGIDLGSDFDASSLIDPASTGKLDLQRPITAR